MATMGLNSGQWVGRLLNPFGEDSANGGSPSQGRDPDSEVNDGTCPENQFNTVPTTLKSVPAAIGAVIATPNSKLMINNKKYDKPMGRIESYYIDLS
jgi:hypothetical protein